MKKKEKVKKIIDTILIWLFMILVGIWLGTGIRYHQKAIDYFTASTHLAFHHLEQVGCDAIVDGKVD